MPIELKPVTLNELPLLQEQLPKLQNGDCNLSIASVIGRAKEYNIKWGISQGELVLNWAPLSGYSAGLCHSASRRKRFSYHRRHCF